MSGTKWVITSTIICIICIVLYFTILKDTACGWLLFAIVASIQGIDTQIEYKENKTKFNLFFLVLFYVLAIVFLILFLNEAM